MRFLLPWKEFSNNPRCYNGIGPIFYIRQELYKSYLEYYYGEFGVYNDWKINHWITARNGLSTGGHLTAQDAMKAADQQAIETGYILINDVNKLDKIKLLK